jgi:hypothetical protein
MKKWVQVSLYILLGLLLGAFLSVAYISYHDIAKSYVKKKLIETFKQDYFCDFKGEVTELNFLNLSCKIEHVMIKPLQTTEEEWFVYMDSLAVEISWISLLWDHIFLLKGTCEQLSMHESFMQSPYKLSEFLEKISQAPGSEYIQYDKLLIVDGAVSFSDMKNCSEYCYSYTANIAQDEKEIQLYAHLNDGHVLVNGHRYAESIHGNIRGKMPIRGDITQVSFNADLQIDLPDLAGYEKNLFFGKFEQGTGIFSIKNKKGLFAVDEVKINYSQDKILSSMNMIITPKLLSVLGVAENLQKNIQGNCSVAITGDLLRPLETVQADLCIDKIVYNEKILFHNFLISLKRIQDHFLATVLLGDTSISGPIYFNEKIVSANFVNLQAISLFDDRWNIDAKNGSIKILIDEKSHITGAYDLFVTQKYRPEPIRISGSFFAHAEQIKLEGKIDEREYECSCLQNPFYLENLVVKDQDKKIIHFYTDKTNKNKVVGFVDFDFVRLWAPPGWKSSFAQAGSFLFEGEIKNAIYVAHVHTHDAHIRIPKIYNVVNSFDASAEIDLYNYSVALNNVICKLYEGDILCKQARFIFDKNGKLSFVHAPLFFQNVMLSRSKEIFSTFSGNIHCEKRNERLNISGFLVAERSQFKGNILSQEFQDEMFGSISYDSPSTNNFNCDFDVHMITRDAIEVQTSFINTDLRGKVDLTGSFQQPELNGSINLHKGSFAFPYKSLEIMRGKISWLSGSTYDPTIDVVARGKLKRYEITMRVSGSMYDQKIAFESVPYLEEQQILGLLLAGSEESSFNLIAPAFLMQSFKDLVFGPAISKSSLHKLFGTLLKPLKGVRFIPQFTNQTGRGGMRLVVEADMTERLSGRVDSNFMQIEDTQFEVNYAASDEITLRALIDGQRSIGGEVEMRWKFNEKRK